jgi:molecular chaperone GrpE
MTEDTNEESIENAAEEVLQEPQALDPLEQSQLEVTEYKDKYLRLLAESENMRKRLTKEKQEMTAYALQQVLAEFLSPIDHMENALGFTEQMSDEVKHWGLGFKMILTQFKDVLSNHGAKAFNSIDTPFDPHLHEAVEIIERDDIPPGIVVEEFVKGYKMGEKILRPARVKVSKTPLKTE